MHEFNSNFECGQGGGGKKCKKFADVIYASPLISPSHLVSSEGRESNYSEWQRPPPTPPGPESVSPSIHPQIQIPDSGHLIHSHVPPLRPFITRFLSFLESTECSRPSLSHPRAIKALKPRTSEGLACDSKYFSLSHTSITGVLIDLKMFVKLCDNLVLHICASFAR